MTSECVDANTSTWEEMTDELHKCWVCGTVQDNKTPASLANSGVVDTSAESSHDDAVDSSALVLPSTIGFLTSPLLCTML